MKTSTDRTAEIRRSDLFNRDFLLQNMKDPSLVNDYMKQNLFLARRLAITLGSVLILSLLSVVYGFIQREVALQTKGEFFARTGQLVQCQEETKKQTALATEAAIIAEEVLQVANEQLDACLKGK